MTELVLHPTSTAQWHSLIHEAQQDCGLFLEEELESYLVFLLMRFISRPDIASSVCALQFLEGLNCEGHVRQARMRDVGDQCLLFCGLFPHRAQRRRVRISYFVNIGQGAFRELADIAREGLSHLYHQVTHGFVPMMDVLQTVRAMDGKALLDPLSATELWADTRSRAAQQVLLKTTEDLPFPAQLMDPGTKEPH